MAKERIINTRFWMDSYISTLDPVEKLFFLYLLTNDKTNISGIYELPLRYIAIDTGIDGQMIVKIFKRFEKDKKIVYLNPWIIIINFLKHQHTESNTVISGIVRELKSVPKGVVIKAKGVGYAHEMGRVWVGYGEGINRLAYTKLNLTKLNKPKKTGDFSF